MPTFNNIDAVTDFVKQRGRAELEKLLDNDKLTRFQDIRLSLDWLRDDSALRGDASAMAQAAQAKREFKLMERTTSAAERSAKFARRAILISVVALALTVLQIVISLKP
jgi:hypothetical protein